MGWFERPEFGANVGLIDEIYRQYLDNPESVSPAWRDFFAENEPEGYEDPSPQHAPTREAPTREAPTREAPTREPPTRGAAADAQPKTEAAPATPAPKQDGKSEPNLVPLRGAAARIVEAMEASREVPT